MSQNPIVPYITRWSTEENLPTRVIQRPTGIAFADENIYDRDGRGILWSRVPSRPGQGRPEFGKVHPLRQRHAMAQLLCQVCAGPSDVNSQGTLWLIPDYPGYHQDWPDWPERLATTEPPICQPCAETALRLCPALRKGNLTMRVAHSTVSGIYGALYRPGPITPKAIEDATLPFTDPAIRWTCAGHLARELTGCTMFNS
jgi:hypothetical protein